ncbi:MAG: hypothetical protein HYW48_08080 [Deltaproteobacteria bacterium]|nr:hypothetical protein [Deltaproteobacteria bacterium]
MVSAAALRRRPIRIIMMAGYFSVILYLTSFVSGTFENYASGANELQIDQTFYLPLREISGLDARPLKNDTFELLAVGDRYAQVLFTHFNLTSRLVENSEVIDYTDSIVDYFAICHSDRIPDCHKLKKSMTSQWEAIKSDASGRIYLLHEQFASIVVIRRDSTEVEGVINLEHFELTRNRRDLKENALGEGMVLLKNGHIMVAKEREKAAMIEFGPADDPAEGYQISSLIRSKDTFPLNTSHTSYVPLHYWKLPADFRPCDLSEVSADSEGNLYILSQKCRMIAQIGELSLDQNKMTFVNTWGLPKNISGAEAFVVLPGHRFLVAQDRKSEHAPNLHLLSSDSK